jgi:hypothetical protein
MVCSTTTLVPIGSAVKDASSRLDRLHFPRRPATAATSCRPMRHRLEARACGGLFIADRATLLGLVADDPVGGPASILARPGRKAAGTLRRCKSFHGCGHSRCRNTQGARSSSASCMCPIASRQADRYASGRRRMRLSVHDPRNGDRSFRRSGRRCRRSCGKRPNARDGLTPDANRTEDPCPRAKQHGIYELHWHRALRQPNKLGCEDRIASSPPSVRR